MVPPSSIASPRSCCHDRRTTYVVVGGSCWPPAPARGRCRAPYFFIDQFDLGMEYIGWVALGAEPTVVVRGDLAAREFIAYWLVDGHVVAGLNANIWDVIEPIEALIRSGAVVDPARLADPTVELSDR